MSLMPFKMPHFSTIASSHVLLLFDKITLSLSTLNRLTICLTIIRCHLTLSSLLQADSAGRHQTTSHLALKISIQRGTRKFTRYPRISLIATSTI